MENSRGSLRYTNFLLTVIAVCMVLQCIHTWEKRATAAAFAGSGIQRVEVVSLPPVSIGGVAMVKPVVPVDVKVINRSVPVEIGWSPWAAPLPVSVKSFEARSSVPVTVEDVSMRAQPIRVKAQ